MTRTGQEACSATFALTEPSRSPVKPPWPRLPTTSMIAPWDGRLAQRLLGTTEIVLIHHTDCGMLTFHDDDVKAQIEADTGLRPPFALEAFGDLDADVRQSIARIKASPYIPHKDSVRGFVYEVETGRLREVKD